MLSLYLHSLRAKKQPVMYWDSHRWFWNGVRIGRSFHFSLHPLYYNTHRVEFDLFFFFSFQTAC